MNIYQLPRVDNIAINRFLRISIAVFIGMAAIKNIGFCSEAEYQSIKANIVSVAIQYTGFRTDKGFDSTNLIISKINFVDSTTPFLGHYAENRPAWKVEFKGVDFSYLDSYAGDNKDLSRDFVAYFDSADGSFLKIEYKSDRFDSKACPCLLAEESESRLNRSSEKYLGIPKTPPTISFFEALQKNPINEKSAESIEGQYVLYTPGKTEPKPVWIITLCGLPPMPAPGLAGARIRPEPEYQRNRMLTVIDAITGRILFSASYPSVPLQGEDKK